MIKHRFFMAMLVLSLTACGKNDPIPLPVDKQQLVGVWQAKQTEFDNGVSSDNMMLVFHKNSRVSYLRCINRINGHNYYNFPDAKLVNMSDTGFEIARDIFVTDWNIKFSINRLPFKEKEDWYFMVNKVKLRKLKAGETSDYKSWQCGGDGNKKADSTTNF